MEEEPHEFLDAHGAWGRRLRVGAVGRTRLTRRGVRLVITALLALLCGLSWLTIASAQTPEVQPTPEVVASRRLDWPPDVAEAVQRGLGFLERQQVEQTGAVGSAFPVAVTSLTGLAVLGSGHLPREGRYSRLLEGCIRYIVASEQRSFGVGAVSGYITDGGESSSRMHGHCYAILLLTQAVGSLSPELDQRVSGVVERGVRVIERAQSREGGWYYEPNNSDNQDEASVTVCALQALRSARDAGFQVAALRIKSAMRYVKRCQHKDGSVAYALNKPEQRTYALTAAAVSTMHAAGVYDSRELALGLEYLQRHLKRRPKDAWNPASEEYPYYSNFYAAQAFYRRGGDLWQNWLTDVRRHLLRTQNAEGAWESTFGREYATAVALLILEVPLGYLPLFER